MLSAVLDEGRSRKGKGGSRRGGGEEEGEEGDGEAEQQPTERAWLLSWHVETQPLVGGGWVPQEQLWVLPPGPSRAPPQPVRW